MEELGDAVRSGRCRRLVVVRAGDASLHPTWFDGSEAPTFDLAVSYYGDDPKAYADAPIRHIKKGGICDGLHAFFADNPELLDKYDWVWLPDDDIATTTACINRLFDVAEEHRLQIAQPTLTWDSYFSHFITVQNPRFKLRWTNFVEVMVPIFSTAALRRILPAFPPHRFGYGIDFLWARWLSAPAFGTAVIDEVAVRHTRPVGRGNLSHGADTAQRAELRRLLNTYALEKAPRRAVYAGLDKKGRLLLRGPPLWAALYAGWMPLRRLQLSSGRVPIKTGRLIRYVQRMALRRPDLTPLPLPFELDQRA